jgi:hypothetical protein
MLVRSSIPLTSRFIVKFFNLMDRDRAGRMVRFTL